MEVYLERDQEMIFTIGSLLRDRDICFAFSDVNHIWRDFCLVFAMKLDVFSQYNSSRFAMEESENPASLRE